MAYADARAKELSGIGDKLFSIKASMDTLHQELAENFYPERADFTRTRIEGEEFADHLMDSYPVLARRTLGDTFSAMLRPRKQDWFHAKAVNDDLNEIPHVKDWLERMTKRTRTIIYDRRSQFTRSTKEGDHDFATFGQCAQTVGEKRDRTGLLFRCWHLRDCAWAESDEGVIDTVHRKAKLSARSIVAKFPKTASSHVKDCLERDPHKEFQLRHIVLPVDDYDLSAKRRPRNAEFVSIILDHDNCVILEELFLPEFTYVIPRWATVSGSPYGYSPATSVSLPDGRLAQAIARVILEAGEKAVDPPVVAQQEVIRSDLQLYAGGVTWADKDYDERLGEAMRVLEMGKNPGLGVDLQQRVQNLITEAFYLNKIVLPPVTPDMTAYEVQKRYEEYLRQVLPLFEPVETEYNGALLDTTTRMLLRLGAYGRPDEMPEELRDENIEWRFENPLQEARERQKVNQFGDVAALTTSAAQIEPKVVKHIDVQRAFRDAVSGSGAPAAWLRPADDVKADLLKDEQAAKTAQTVEAVNVGAETVQNVAGAEAALQDVGGVQALQELPEAA